MQNPFIKNDNSTLIALITISAVIAGTLAYLYLTENGAETRKAIKHKFIDEAKDIASEVVSNKTGFKKNTVKKAADFAVE